MSTDDGDMDVGMMSPAASGPDVAALGDALEPAPEAVDLQARQCVGIHMSVARSKLL